MIFLVDHNLEGHALLLSGSIANQGWQDLCPIRFITLEETTLTVNSSDQAGYLCKKSILADDAVKATFQLEPHRF